MPILFNIIEGTEPVSFSLGDDPRIINMINAGSPVIDYTGDKIVWIWNGDRISDDTAQLTFTVPMLLELLSMGISF